MTLPHFTKEELIQYFGTFGFHLDATVIADSEPDIETFVLLHENGLTIFLDNQEKYFFPLICKHCELLGIPIPQDFENAWNGLKNYPDQGSESVAIRV